MRNSKVLSVYGLTNHIPTCLSSIFHCNKENYNRNTPIIHTQDRGCETKRKLRVITTLYHNLASPCTLLMHQKVKRPVRSGDDRAATFIPLLLTNDTSCRANYSR